MTPKTFYQKITHPESGEVRIIWMEQGNQTCEFSYLKNEDGIDVLSAIWSQHFKPYKREPGAFEEIPKSEAQPVILAFIQQGLHILSEYSVELEKKVKI